MSLVRLSVRGISYSQTQQGAYALILGEESSDRKLPIVIGAAEAQSIAIAIEEDLKPPRPLTHDLLKHCLERFSIGLKEVVIHKLKDGVFYSSLICIQGDREEILDARTSDAVAMAVRMGSPIYTYPEIMDQAAIDLNTDFSAKSSEIAVEPLSEDIEKKSEVKSELQGSSPFKRYTEKQLRAALKKAIDDEDYQKAALLRDEIENRFK